MATFGILVTVFTASLLGSLHCGVMCGPLFLSLGRQRRAVFFYQIGRLAAYLALGLAAGSLGALGFRTLLESPLGTINTLIVSAFFIASGLRLLSGRSGPVGAFLSRNLHRLTGPAARVLARCKNPELRGLGLGLVTAVLPCGWLYLFVSTALVLANPLHGALLLLVFWSGSLPVFSVLHEVKAGVLGRMQRQGSVAAACLLIVLGVFLPFLKLTSFSHEWTHSLLAGPTFLVDKITGGQASLNLPDEACRGR